MITLRLSASYSYIYCFMTGGVSSHARNHLKLSLHDVARTVETVHMCTGKEIRNLCTYFYIQQVYDTYINSHVAIGVS